VLRMPECWFIRALNDLVGEDWTVSLLARHGGVCLCQPAEAKAQHETPLGSHPNFAATSSF
jgi:hypothetical protein